MFSRSIAGELQVPYKDQTTVTRLLEAVRAGDRDALEELFPLIYQELHQQAQCQRERWHGNNTINTTALVQEAYLKLVDRTQAQWNSRAHFLAVAAKAMRHILIDYAKKSKRIKRGGPLPKVSLVYAVKENKKEDITIDLDGRADELVALDRALQYLSTKSERQCRVVECRFFGGMTIFDTATALNVSPATVKRDWVMAQAWLYREISG